MRILLVCPYDWEAPGGVQIHVRQLAAERTLHDRFLEATDSGI